jgi:RNA polymerase-associated protein RTF1
MSQSDSEAEADFMTGDKPLFPYERLYYSASDKANIDSKNEIERERLLADREEDLLRHEQDAALRRLVSQREKEEARVAAKNKRKANAADLDEGQRKSSRQRTKLGGGRAGEASSSIEAYKKQREEKRILGEQRKRAPARRLSPHDEYSDDDGEAESEDDYDYRRSKKRSSTPTKDDPPAELSDIQKARIGRDNFAQVCYTPGFENAVTGCFARVCLGPGRTPGLNEYRVCSIKAITTGRPYAMTGENGRPFLTEKYIVAAHGKAEKPWSFLECSMSRFTEDEWRRYRVTMANEDCKMPTRGYINRRLDEINKLLKFKWNDESIDRRVIAQKELQDKVYRIDEKEDLKTRISHAKDKGDLTLAADLEDQLANIVPMKLALGTSLVSKVETNKPIPQEDRLEALNRRNQKLNAENIRKAQLAEMHARKVVKKTHLAPGVEELFEGGSDISRSGTPVNGLGGTPKLLAATISRSGTPIPTYHLNGTPRGGTPVPSTLGAGAKKPAEKKRPGLPVIRKAMMDDEILAGMDLGIDIDI